jgi:hypothetical protein
MQDELTPLPTAEYVPATQNPFPIEELHFVKQYAPAGQGKHAEAIVEPSITLYVPASQCVQEKDFPVPNIE